MAINKRKLAKSGKDSWVIYKGDTDVDIISLMDTLKTNHSKSVVIHKWGNLSDKDITDLENMCDDYAYHELHLKPDDYFLVTKEITPMKMDEERKLNKVNKVKINRIKTEKPKLHKVQSSTYNWTEDQLKYLWTGTSETVAKIVNKKASSVERKRKEYLKDNPNEIYPESCKLPRKNAAKPKNHNYDEWSNLEKELLWSDNGKALSKILNHTIRSIHNERIKYCQDNPNFIIPLKSKFIKGELPNSVENVDAKRNVKIWSNEEKELLWTTNAKNIIDKYPNRTYHQIYQARCYFLKKNPNFVIPASACFTAPKGFNNVVEKISAPRIITKVKDKEIKNFTKSSSIELADIINNLTVKPKKMKLVDGVIELEF